MFTVKLDGGVAQPLLSVTWLVLGSEITNNSDDCQHY